MFNLIIQKLRGKKFKNSPEYWEKRYANAKEWKLEQKIKNEVVDWQDFYIYREV